MENNARTIPKVKIGQKIGHKFKPWEAVKWVKGINVAGKVLGVFGVVFSVDKIRVPFFIEENM